MSNLQEIKDKIKSNKPALKAKYNVDKIGVFGSYSRNDQNENSDIDILVEFSEPIGLEFVALADELEKLLGQKVDLVSRKGIKEKYFKIIEKDLQYV